MKNHFKKVVSIILAASMAASMMVSVASAKWVDISGNGYYNKYVTCTLNNKRQDATIWVDCYNTVASANDIKMTTTSGRHIWSQSRALSISGFRSFRLGCDYSAYRIYLKTYVNYGKTKGGTANIYGNNVTIR